MKDTLTQKQELFTLNLFQGMTNHDAWIQAGYSSKYAPAIIDTNACRLAKQTNVQLRLAELRAEIKSKAIMTVEERKIRLSELSRAKLVDFVNVDGSITLTGDNNAAISEYQVDEIDVGSGDDKKVIGRAKKLKLLNPIQAISELNKMEGIGTPKADQLANITINIISGIPRPQVIEVKQLEEGNEKT